MKANEWIQAITSLMQGKGGGKSESAQASGSNIVCLNEIVSKANEFADQKLGITSKYKNITVIRYCNFTVALC